MKVSFDIGGVVAKYPEKFKALMKILFIGGAQIYVITDMPKVSAVEMLRENGFDYVLADRIFSADYEGEGERCKQFLIEKHGIDIHLDDFAAYCSHESCISLFVWPNPDKPYYADDFKTKTDFKFGRVRSKKIV